MGRAAALSGGSIFMGMVCSGLQLMAFGYGSGGRFYIEVSARCSHDCDECQDCSQVPRQVHLALRQQSENTDSYGKFHIALKQARAIDWMRRKALDLPIGEALISIMRQAPDKLAASHLFSPHESAIEYLRGQGSLRSMSTVLRNLASRIMVLFRLAVVLSLAGYTMPNANAAMHGSPYPEASIVAEASHHGDAHSHGSKVVKADADHHRDGGDGGKSVQKNCCQDFCFSIALPSPSQTSVPARVSMAFAAFDDSRVHGTRPSLHRPPKI